MLKNVWKEFITRKENVTILKQDLQLIVDCIIVNKVLMVSEYIDTTIEQNRKKFF
jgi:hypothetical protein